MFSLFSNYGRWGMKVSEPLYQMQETVTRIKHYHRWTDAPPKARRAGKKRTRRWRII